MNGNAVMVGREVYVVSYTDEGCEGFVVFAYEESAKSKASEWERVYDCVCVKKCKVNA